MILCSCEAPSIIEFRGSAMTIPYQVTVGEPCDEQKVKAAISASFSQIDRSVNNWNPQSEVSALNRLLPHQTLVISAAFAAFLQEVAKVVEETGGLFDPTIGPVQKLWRRQLESGTIPTEEALEALRSAIGWEKLHLEGETVWKESPIELDLGGIAKGYAVDLLAQHLLSLGLTRFLVCWGGEVYATGHHPSGRSWQIATPQGMRPLQDEALATSGDSEQFWETSAGTYTHICHPKTLQAVHIQEVGKTISVSAPTCLQADGLATAAYLDSL